MDSMKVYWFAIGAKWWSTHQFPMAVLWIFEW